MASLLLPRLTSSKPLLFGLGLGFSASVLLPSYSSPYTTRRLLCDTSVPAATDPKDWSFSQYTRDAKTPVVRSGGGLNPRAVGQISSGSMLGVISGLAVSMFSKPLALLIGLLIVGLQYAEYKGIHLIPYSRMQRYVGSIDLRSLVQDNVAFKISFGATFALAGFAQF